ncbi:YceI family protein [[Bacillus] enclensis]|uniref:YceI family protein n=1 Tax=[Bacillus] enclensis TaxID=1402860 RepID=UPI0018DB789D|nr:YceI family protein [[Bacillus] enclensis]MBH9966987.1 hypothetical protein [[Bacillus] enclensis]
MGLVLCDCPATAAGSRRIICEPRLLSLSYEFEIDICSGSLPASSSVTGAFTVIVFGLEIEADFVSTEIGFPICTVDACGNQTLTVVVEGTLTLMGVPSDVTFTLSLNEANQEICIEAEGIDPFCLPATSSLGNPVNC